MSENSLFPRKKDIFQKSMRDVREVVARPSIDTSYEVVFSFGNYEKWLKDSNVVSNRKRNQGFDFRKKMSLMCAEAELPGTLFQTNLATGHHQGINEEFPNLRQYPPLNLTFYLDADHVILEVLETWMSFIHPIHGGSNKRQLNAFGRFNYPEDYKEILHVTKFERDTFTKKASTKLSSYEFVNAWPTNLTSMRVAYGNSNVLRCSVTLSYDRFFTKFSYEETNQSVEATIPPDAKVSQDQNKPEIFSPTPEVAQFLYNFGPDEK